MFDFSVNEWWESLGGTIQTFWLIGFASTVFLLLQLLLTLLGFGEHAVSHDHDADLSADHDSLLSISNIFSIKVLTAFFTGFGWMGVWAQENNYGMVPSILFAFLMGCFFGGVVLVLMRLLYSLRSSGNVDYANAVGQVATVYLAVPPSNSGTGIVQVSVQGVLREVEARTGVNLKLNSGSKVKIISLLDNKTANVEPV